MNITYYDLASGANESFVPAIMDTAFHYKSVSGNILPKAIFDQMLVMVSTIQVEFLASGNILTKATFDPVSHFNEVITYPERSLVC